MEDTMGLHLGGERLCWIHHQSSFKGLGAIEDTMALHLGGGATEDTMGLHLRGRDHRRHHGSVIKVEGGYRRRHGSQDKGRGL